MKAAVCAVASLVLAIGSAAADTPRFSGDYMRTGVQTQLSFSTEPWPTTSAWIPDFCSTRARFTRTGSISNSAARDRLALLNSTCDDDDGVGVMAVTPAITMPELGADCEATQAEVDDNIDELNSATGSDVRGLIAAITNINEFTDAGTCDAVGNFPTTWTALFAQLLEQIDDSIGRTGIAQGLQDASRYSGSIYERDVDNYEAIRDNENLEDFAECAELHYYNDRRRPELFPRSTGGDADISVAVADAQMLTGGQSTDPVCVTETGFQVTPNGGSSVTGEPDSISLATARKYIPRLLAGFYRIPAVHSVNLFALANSNCHDPDGDGFPTNYYGLIDCAWADKGVILTLRRFLLRMKDDTCSSITPVDLTVFTTSMASPRWHLTQRCNGSYQLVIWNPVESWCRSPNWVGSCTQHTPITNAAVSTNVTVGPMNDTSWVSYNPKTGSTSNLTATVVGTTSQVTISLLDEVQILEFN